MKKKTLRNVGLAAVSLLLMGAQKSCVTTQSNRPPPTTKITGLKPALTPQAETRSCQEKGGVEICITPVTYTLVERAKTTDQMLYERVKREYDLSGAIFETPVRVIERTTTPYLDTDPSRLKFQVKVINKLPRVFRGQGMVVQFNAAGTLRVVDPSAYAELVNLIVPPRNEQAVYINGPLTKELPPTCPVGLFMYDVVTQTDNAGNITEKQNFEWYFNYATQLEEREGTISKQRLEQAIGPRVRVK